ncbi:class Ia ribonucleotide reductase subunit alpha [Oleiphilus messinensis]|uniref:Vitamin B12-dependent ribonucleotide reductase n=1 Tax=Oleiphilus messinensis TaxID=141451 RepID=A0A1Y0IDP2_9GAMM|nr:ribonucleoside-diphosphate reductase subunit alpha [Oleiphilus messinensis]ARU58648.1 class Ia ribonucleotide reductase subunit alpha [Oleiphilus messinensis]
MSEYVPSVESSGSIRQLFRVIKRNGDAVPFDSSKIAAAITKAFLAVEGPSASGSSRLKTIVTDVTNEVITRLQRRLDGGSSVHIEEVQDLVELCLMRHSLQKVARAYVLYREEHARKRGQETSSSHPLASAEQFSLRIHDVDGQSESLSSAQIFSVLHWACSGLPDVDPQRLFDSAKKALYDGMLASDVTNAMIIAVRPLIESEPAYTKVCAQLLLHKLWAEVTAVMSLQGQIPGAVSAEHYPVLFETGIKYGVEFGLLAPQLLDFDLPRLADALQPERDKQFNYLGLQTLYDRYFLHHNNSRLELPQTFFMRVAMGLSLNEAQPTERAIEFYHLLSSFDYMASTPTLFNSGTLHPQLSSCYLTTVPDDLAGIYGALQDNALLSKWAGGLGNDWSTVRALGARIKGTHGQSQGIVPFLKVVNDTAVAVNQGGKRKGAVCVYLETWHLDIEEFLDLRKNTGDERRRTHDMNTANWIPDLFMKRVFEDGNWTLFSPDEVPDLHELYGAEFEVRYMHYESEAQAGRITLFKTIPAQQLWRKMLTMLFETGHPWLAFKDPCNLRSPQQHCGVVHSSNLCTEITLNTNADEIAVCNLGSVNLVNHIRDGVLDPQHLEATVNVAVRLLDNVIDLNYYPVEKARNANLKHRPIGLGMMGFQDALYALHIPYASPEAVHFADQSMELLSFYAFSASARLAEERGAYPSYTGSLWDQGILPIDSLALLKRNRGSDFCTFDQEQRLNWQAIRDLIARHGLRNSNVLAIAPTATISNIVGVSQSIEPTYQNLFVKSNLSGEFVVTNPWLVQVLKEHDLWDEVMVSDLKYFDGSIAQIERIPEDIKRLFATAFEIDSRWLVEAAARRQKWIDQAQSLNLYLAEPSGKQLDNLYKLAWSRGLKTTYYLRSLGATHMEKQNAVESASNDENTSPKFCSILDPECEACQ